MSLEHLRQTLNDNDNIKFTIGGNNSCFFLLKNQDIVEFSFESLELHYFAINMFHQMTTTFDPNKNKLEKGFFSMCYFEQYHMSCSF